jgi:hypothetical protein
MPQVGDGHSDVGEHPSQQRQGESNYIAGIAVNTLDEWRPQTIDAERAGHGHRLAASDIGGYFGVAGRPEAHHRASDATHTTAIASCDETVSGKQHSFPPRKALPHIEGMLGRCRLAETHLVKVQQRIAAEHQRIRAPAGHRGSLALREGADYRGRAQASVSSLTHAADHHLGIYPGVLQHTQPAS